MSNELEFTFDRYMNDLKKHVNMMKEELEETKKFNDLLSKLDKALDDRGVRVNYSNKKKVAIQQLKDMGYIILDNEHYTNVSLNTNNGIIVSFMMFPQDFELDNIVTMIVGRMNNLIISNL